MDNIEKIISGFSVLAGICGAVLGALGTYLKLKSSARKNIAIAYADETAANHEVARLTNEIANDLRAELKGVKDTLAAAEKKIDALDKKLNQYEISARAYKSQAESVILAIRTAFKNRSNSLSMARLASQNGRLPCDLCNEADDVLESTILSVLADFEKIISDKQEA